MAAVPAQHARVLSGMRPTGRLHLGHYHGVLKNWVELQHEYQCFFFVADWHALTTHYEEPEIIPQSVWDMVIDWLAAGIDPDRATLFIQSRVPEHAELHLLLSMLCPLGWLERVPSYKDQQEKLRERDLATYGFLGYPLLQSADILMYKASFVPVGDTPAAAGEPAAGRRRTLLVNQSEFRRRELARILQEAGLEVRDVCSATSPDFVNLLTLRGGGHSISGTLAGPKAAQRIVNIDDTPFDVPPVDDSWSDG